MDIFHRETMAVKIEKKKILEPYKINPSLQIPLTTFDRQYMCSKYFQKVILYKGANYDEAVQKLEEGLKKVLVQYWPLLGRFKKEGKEIYIGCDCEHKGVEVIEASAENVKVAHLLSDEYSTAMNEMFPYNGMSNSQGFDMPLMSAQFTKLKDGIAIGFSLNHAVADGRSAMNFVLHWADMCKDIASASDLPLYERDNLRTTSMNAWIPRLLCHIALLFTPSRASCPIKSRTFRFSEITLDKIKARANAGRPNHLKPITTFQSIASHIWRAVTIARNSHFLTICVVCIDCHSRMDPPIPSFYFGNLVQSISTITSSCLLTRRSPRFGAKLLHNLINSHGPKVINKASKSLGNLPDMNRYVDTNGNVVMFASSPRFKFYDVDFGWGKPELVMYGSNHKHDGLVLLYPGRGGKGIDAQIWLREKAMEALEKDERFLTGDVPYL